MKILSLKRRRQYELTFLLPATLTEGEVVKTTDEVVALIKKHQGEVTNEEKWGKKRLAYQIKKGSKAHQEAFYVHLQFSLDADQLPKLDQVINLRTDLIRYLLVVAVVKKEQKNEK